MLPSLPTAGTSPVASRPGNRRAVGPSSTATASRSSSTTPGTVSRYRDPQARHQLKDRAIPHTVMAGAVRAGDARPVEHEGDREPVQGHVHQDLVKGPVQERGIDRRDRVHAA